MTGIQYVTDEKGSKVAAQIDQPVFVPQEDILARHRIVA
jgi:hypothetical protein